MKPYDTVTTHDAPARAPSVQADVTTPAAWALISAVVVTLAYLVAAWQWCWPLEGAAPVGIATLLIAWFAASGATRATWWTRKTTTPAEREEPEPEDAGPIIGYEEFIQACVAGGTAWDRWVPYMGVELYREYRDRALRDGVAEWRNRSGTQGWRLKGYDFDVWSW